MSRINLIVVLMAAFLCVYVQTAFQGFRNVIHAQFDLLPALMAYVALSADLVAVAILALVGGVLFDTLSANPLGVSILPLFFIGVILQARHDLILRDMTYAQFIVGCCVSASMPLMTLVGLWAMGERPIVGLQTLWQWLVMALVGGGVTPFFFHLFDRLELALNYSAAPAFNESMARHNREIKRGRGH
jgi:cell shape-determining protein MreD